MFIWIEHWTGGWAEDVDVAVKVKSWGSFGAEIYKKPYETR